MVYTHHPSIWGTEDEYQEFRVNLSYKVSSRLAGSTQDLALNQISQIDQLKLEVSSPVTQKQLLRLSLTSDLRLP